MNILWDETPTARTSHRCDACGRAINPGETYRRMRIVGDDGPYTHKQCAHCRAFINLYIDEFCLDRWEGWYREEIDEWEPVTDVARELKRQFFIGWRHDRDLYPVPELQLT